MKYFLLFLTLVQHKLIWGSEIAEGSKDEIAIERNKHSRVMMSYMDTSVDPCDDFYQYSCGNYLRVNPLEKAREFRGSLYSLMEVIDEALEELFTKGKDSGPDEIQMENRTKLSNLEKKVKNFYSSCMNANIFNYRKSEVYLDFINSIGGWPALDENWSPENFDWFKTITNLSSYGVEVFISITNGYPDYVSLSSEQFGLYNMDIADIQNPSSKNYQINKEITLRLMSMYGIPRRKALVVFNEIMEFGQRWANIMFKSAYRQSEDYSFTITKLMKKVPRLNWENYFDAILRKPVNYSVTLYLSDESYLRLLPVLINTVDPKVVANYIMLKTLYELHDEFKSIRYEKTYCKDTLDKYMGPILSKIFLNSKYYSLKSEEYVKVMINYTLDAAREEIERYDWRFNQEMKKRNLRRISNMEIQIGESVSMINETVLVTTYGDLEIDSNNFQGNKLKLRKILVSERIGNEEISAINVNAYQSFQEIIILPGIMRKPVLYLEMPNSYNFGALGAVLGHETMHALSSIKSAQECFIKQYNKYKIFELNKNVDGEFTLEENRSDNAGLRFAFQAYRNWLKDNQDEINEERDEILPNLNMTSNQLFFLSYGQIWCSGRNWEAYLDKRNNHALERFRVNGAVSNFDMFSKEFNCKLGSPMNSRKKCIDYRKRDLFTNNLS